MTKNTLFITLLGSLLLSSVQPAFAMTKRTVITTETTDGETTVTEEEEDAWFGPGYYYGIWFDTEADYWSWRDGHRDYPSNRRYYHHEHPIYYHPQGGHPHGGGGHGGGHR